MKSASRKTKNDKAAELIRPNHIAWAMKPYWSVDEAAALMLDVDPIWVTRCDDEKTLRIYTMAKQGIVAFQESGQLPALIRPAVFIELMRRTHNLGAPPMLVKAVLDYEENADNGVALLKKENQTLHKQVQTIAYQLKNSKPLGSKERETLLLIIYAMASTKYGFGSGKLREDAVPDILDDLMHLGLKVSDDSIRSWLKEAKEAVENTSRRLTKNG